MKRFLKALWPIYLSVIFTALLCFRFGYAQVSGWPYPFTSFSPLTIGIPNNTAIDLKDGSSINQNAFIVDNSSNLVLATGLASVTAGNNVPIRLGSNGLVFQYGGDLSLTHAPRNAYSVFESTIGAQNSVYGWLVPSVAIHARRLSLALDTAPSGCTTYPVVQLCANGTCSGGNIGCAITLASATKDYTATCAIAVSAELQIQVATAASGCTTSPAGANYVAEYTTD